jgi:hypothetical protein
MIKSFLLSYKRVITPDELLDEVISYYRNVPADIQQME